jgi:hypothetical protein
MDRSRPERAFEPQARDFLKAKPLGAKPLKMQMTSKKYIGKSKSLKSK